MQEESFMKIQASLFKGSVALAALSIVIAAGTAAQAQSDPSKGSQVYQNNKCALCHAVQGKGGKAGPDLSTVGAKRNAQWLEKFMKDPKAVTPGAKMPPFKGSADDLNALVAYLASLK